MADSALGLLSSAPADRLLFTGPAPVTAGRVRAMAAGLAKVLAGGREPICLFSRTLSLFSAGLLAAARTGRPVICPAHLNPDYLQEIGAGNWPVVTDMDAQQGIDFGVDDAAAAPQPAPEADGLALTFFSSGSTGAPKPIRKSLDQLDREAVVLCRLWGEGQDRGVLATVSHQHIYGMLFRLFWPLHAGMTARDEAIDFWESLAPMLRADQVLVTSPAHLSRMPPDLSGTPSRIFSSGGPLAPADAARAHAVLGCWPIEVYGSTETGGVAWRQQEEPEAPWTLFPGVELEEQAEGKVRVRSAHANAGRQAELNDGVLRLPDGRFRLTGRLDRVAKVDGKRISLARVEAALEDLPQVIDAVCCVLPDRRGQLAAVLQLGPAGEGERRLLGTFRFGRKLRQSLAARLEAAERPKHWRYVGQIPQDAQGKRRLADLQALFVSSDRRKKTEAQDLPGLKIEAVEIDGDRARLDLAVGADLPYLQGHFPELPVLAGVAQLHLAVELAERLWQWRPDGSNLARLKFSRLLRPPERITLELVRDCERGRLSFVMRTAQGKASEGRVGGAV